MAELKSQDPAPISPTTSDPPLAERNLSQGTDALSHLARMSGTGSTFGAADYVAINTTAVACLILGFAGALSLLLSLFLFLPLLGILCGLLAIYQIRQSNGTQGGYAFATGGILISILFGGIVGVRETRDWLTVRAQTKQCAALVARFGDDLKGGHYDDAYDALTSDAFRARVARAQFRGTFEDIEHMSAFGPIVSMEWNGLPMIIERMPDDSLRVIFGTLINFRDLKEPSREEIQVTGKDNDWKIASIPRLFPEKKPKAPGI